MKDVVIEEVPVQEELITDFIPTNKSAVVDTEWDYESFFRHMGDY